MIEKLAEELWKRGVDVSLSDLRRWSLRGVDNPEEIADLLARIKEKTGADWFTVVTLNQVQHMFENDDECRDYIAKLVQSEAHPAAAIVTWRREPISPYAVIYRKVDAPKYFESSESPIEFFENFYRYEGGIDFDGLSEKLKNVLDERLIDEFFRLVDIDAPLPPEEFVKRVEKGVDVLATAKEQGLDVRRIFRKWDELANAGGERMKFLAAAVKAVAEEAVRERFWEEIAKILNENGVKVFDGEVPEDTIGSFYYLGMVDIHGKDIDVADAEKFLANVAAFLRNARAIPMYNISEIANAFEKMGIRSFESKEDAEFVADVLAEMDRRAAKVFLESDVSDAVIDAVLRARNEGIDEEAVASAVNEALIEVYQGSIAGKEEVAQFLEKKLFS